MHINSMNYSSKRVDCIVYGLIVLISFALLTVTVIKLNAKLEVHQDAHIITSKVQIDSYGRIFESWLEERSKRVESVVYHGLSDISSCSKGACIEFLERSIADKIDEFSTYTTRVKITKLNNNDTVSRIGKPIIVIEQSDVQYSVVRIEQVVILFNYKVAISFDAQGIMNELFSANELNKLRALYLFNPKGERVKLFGNHVGGDDEVQLDWLVERISHSKISALNNIGEGHIGNDEYVVWNDNLDGGFALVALLQKGTYDVFVNESKSLFYRVIFLLISSLIFSLYGIYLIRRRLAVITERYHDDVHEEVAYRTKNLYKMQVELNETNNELRRKADRDPLTGLANRRRFLEIVKSHWNSAEGQSAAVLMIDLDHFKCINDTHGHIVGDACLVEIGKVLKRFRLNNSSVRAVGRYGGEEFIALLTNVTKGEAKDICERIRTEIAKAKFGSSKIGEILHMTCSIGSAYIQDLNAAPFEYVLQEADIALYQAKESGRDKVVMYDNSPRPISVTA